MNSYSDTRRAEAYSKLAYPGTYYLAFRDLPDLICKYVKGTSALDFGCGTGRSTRFLKSLGYNTVGVDISAEMLKIAKELDPCGEYVEVEDGNLSALTDYRFNLIFSAFSFDNIFTKKKKIQIFNEFRKIIRDDSIVINMVSSPELYTNDWLSFKTTCFPNNFTAKNGEIVNTIITDTDDERPVDDELCTDSDYRDIYEFMGFEILNIHRPLGRMDDPYKWLNEDRIAPWTIYVLKKCL